MKHKIIILLSLIFFACNNIEAYANNELYNMQKSVIKISEKCKSSIVLIRCTVSDQTDYIPSYAIDDNGHLVAIIRDVLKYETFTVLSGGTYSKVQLIGFDKITNLVVFKSDIITRSINQNESYENLENGQIVLALSKNQIVDLIIAYGNLNKSKYILDNHNNYVSVDRMCINSIIFDLNGSFVGLQTGVLFRKNVFQNIISILPSDFIIKGYNDIIRYGKIQRPFVGITIITYNDEYAKEINLHGDYGILIGMVQKNSPAEKSGLKAGDVIIEFDGIKMKREDGATLLNLIKKKNINEKIILTIYRKNEYKQIELLVDEIN